MYRLRYITRINYFISKDCEKGHPSLKSSETPIGKGSETGEGVRVNRFQYYF